MNTKQQRRASLRSIEDRDRKRNNGTTDPAHYRLLKACAQKLQLRIAARKGKAYRPLTPTELDDIASGATIHFVELQRSSTIVPPHNSCECNDCLKKLEQRAITSAYSAAKWARSEYFRSQICDGKRVNATDTDDFDALYQDHPQPMHDLDTMLGQLANDRQRRLAELLANQATMEQITSDVGYKSWPAVTYAKRQIAKRLADYEPQAATRTRLPEDTIEAPIVRAIRVAIKSVIREGKPTIVRERATLRIVNVYHGKPWPKLPSRTKSTAPVDIAIKGEPQRALPELWAKHIGLGQGRTKAEQQSPQQPVPQQPVPTTYWQSPYIAYLTSK